MKKPRSNTAYKNRSDRYRFLVGTVERLRAPIRRNAPCPFCPSGRKFKHCCLKLTVAFGPDAGIPVRVVS